MSEAPALGYSFVANIGGDRQITVQCFVGSDETPKVINANIDKAAAIIDRLKAKYDLVDLKASLADREKTLAQFTEDEARLEVSFAEKKALVESEIAKAEGLREETYEAGYDAHVKSGRRGAYHPAGLAKQNLAAIDSHKKNLIDSLAKEMAERDAAFQNLGISKQRHEADVVRLKAQIAECEAKLKDD